jgi:ribonuclease HI
MKKIYNPMVVRMMNQTHRKKEHLILIWVPGHAGIQGNEKADQHARGNQRELQNHYRRLEQLDIGETVRNKTSRMDII